ncbi:MAG TPA: cytochrome ubiquinol oxidase subunit I [Bryobacteraceae bacterium]|jgi:cytochrome d ubiquinol oxidase subunit I
MSFDAVVLARIHFALTIMFHYLFPPLSIGLGLILVLTEGLYLRTGKRLYEDMARFWTRIFAVNFAVGVATGIVMEFEFGTNWSTYARFVGDVFGSALAAEGVFAFFLESGFLAVLVFGWERVSAKMHFFATCMVALGAAFSATWIVIANSWQQTPAGFHVVGSGVNARAEITDFWAMVFNPSSLHRLGHVMLGAYILGGFFVMSVASFYILRRRHLEFAEKSFAIGLAVATVASLAQLISGDGNAKMVGQYQPAKMAAFEGHFTSENHGTEMYLFGLPDAGEQRVKYGIAVPYMLSLLMYEDPDRPVRALDTFPERDRPPAGTPFQAYHLMIALGTLNIALTLTACYLLWKKRLFQKVWLMRIFGLAVLSPYLANEAGWVAAETGRQPWTVYGLLRTADSVSKSVPAGQILASIVIFGVIYALLFAVWVFVMNAKIVHGPDESGTPPSETSERGLIEAVASYAHPHARTLTEES